MSYLTHEHARFVWRGPYELRLLAQNAGFEWSDRAKAWSTKSIYQAYLLARYADDNVKARLSVIDRNIKYSWADSPVLGSPGRGYYPFQEAGIEHMIGQIYKKRKAVLCGDEPGCVFGGTEITVQRNSGSRTYGISQAYKHFHGLADKCQYNWDRSKPTFVRALKGDRFGPHYLKDIVFKGVKTVFKLVLEDGKTLIATPDHEVMTQEGWITMVDLFKGHEVMVNGDDVCPDCGTTENLITYKRARFLGFCKTCMLKKRRARLKPAQIIKVKGDDGYTYLRGMELGDHPKYGHNGILEHVYKMEKHLNRSLKKHEEVHHKNEIRDDNSLSNLIVLTKSQHSKLHKMEYNFKDFMHSSGSKVITIPKFSSVVSCKPYGEKEVYDLVMGNPHRNFLANKIVVHNCGKTIEAIGVANELKLKKLLVVCPASLRLNWVIEINKWHEHSQGAEAVLTGKHVIDHNKSMATSYELASVAHNYEPDLIIIDESHRLKNPATVRSRYVLGDMSEEWYGLVQRAPTLFLTGTPTPNGRPSELWSVVFRCAPEVIDYLKYFPFVRQFCEWYNDGNEIIVTGAKNTQELYTRLRGSGFMIRREMDDVLKDLPPLRYKMVVFPVNSISTRMVLNKEKAFSADEILKQGTPVGTSYPTIRKEMGIAKLPQDIDYIKEVLDNGVDKVVVFAHHVDVVYGLLHGLKSYNPVAVLGATPPKRRDKNVFAFQNDPTVRVFIGNEAAEEGYTLTAAANIIETEFEWVPGKEDQRPRRLRRIGQKRPVIVHQLVVQNSIDAKILSRAMDKDTDNKGIYRGDINI